MTKLTRYEKETIIQFNAEEDKASIYTADQVVMRKLDKLVEEQPEYFTLEKVNYYKDGEIVSKSYIIASKGLVRISKKREISEERKDALRENMLRYWENKRKEEFDISFAEDTDE